MGDNNLNQLLEDALDDLLLDKDDEPTTGDSASVAAVKEKKKEPPETMMVDEKEMDKFFASMTEKLNSAEMPKIDPSESVPQILDLMQNLLSKELLYPALKDLSPKFEDWLKKNLTSLSKEDRRRYKEQLSKIHEIIDVFDDESLEDRERFEKNLVLMEQMQSLGAPPEELTVPDGMSKCSIM